LPEAQIDAFSQFHGGQSKTKWPLHIYRLRLSGLDKWRVPAAK
jgi:hypothetical protein